ncbi:MAG TPA: hypothetical protein VN721_12235 [Flavipsychrobacter sp.]|nr:hypothetical protein [Flavipsychrobacter sp.]
MKQLIRKLPLIICCLCAFVLGMKQLREPDIWWQLLSGRWMLEHMQVTHTDMFSYTMAGHPWVNVKWLYEIIIAIIEKAMGPEGVLLLQSIVNVVIVYLLQRSLSLFRRSTRLSFYSLSSVVSIILFLAIVEYRMAGRPEMISHLLCCTYLFFLWRYPDLRFKNIFWLVVLQCLWANMHEGYPVGLVILGTFCCGSFLAYLFKRDKDSLNQLYRAIILLVAAAFIVLLNPNGIKLWQQPFEIYRQVWANKYTTELYSFHDPQYWTIEAKLHIVLLVLVILFWINKIAQWRKEKNQLLYSPAMLTYLLLIPLFGYLSLTANRNIPFAQIVLFPSVPVMITWLVQKVKADSWRIIGFFKKRSVGIASVIAAIFYISIVSNYYYKVTKSPNRYGFHVSMLHNPIGAANFLKQYNIKGTAFSDYFVSSYLLWSLYPDFKSYIDLRDLDVFSTSFFDQYFQIYKQPSLFNDLDKKYNFNYVVVSTSQLISLQQNLYWKPGFNMVYVDPVAAIFLRQNDANKPLNTNLSIQKPFSWPSPPDDPAWAAFLNKLLNPAVNYNDEDEVHAPVYAALFYDQMMDYPNAIHLLKPQMANLQDDPEAYITLANSYMMYGNVVKDLKQKQVLQDSAQYYMQLAQDLKH